MDNHYGGVIWTNHALARLKERGISQSDAWATFNRPRSSRYAATKGGWVFYRNWSGYQIEVVASKNEKGEWVILSVWSSQIPTGKAKSPASPNFLENLVEKFLQKTLGRFQKNKPKFK